LSNGDRLIVIPIAFTMAGIIKNAGLRIEELKQLF
jgi:hypothetical protein